MTTQQPDALPSFEMLAAQSQIFASAWSLVGGPFDAGDGMESAEAERAILLDMARRLHTEIDTLRAGYDAARLEIESLQKAATDRHALQATGAHPAPCARYCEAVAFNIERRNLHAENERLRTCNKDAQHEIANLKERVQQLGQLARDVNSRRVQELEAQLAAVGAGGVEPLRKRECLHKISEPAQPVGAAPQWVRVDERLPEPGNAVLLDIGGETPLRAMWAAKHTVEAAEEDDSEWAEYSEANDTYYSPEGWYEWNQHEEVHWAVSAEPVAWMDLPAPYSASECATAIRARNTDGR